MIVAEHNKLVTTQTTQPCLLLTVLDLHQNLCLEPYQLCTRSKVQTRAQLRDKLAQRHSVADLSLMAVVLLFLVFQVEDSASFTN